MADRESFQVGYRLWGIEPPDLARYLDPVKLMFWGWVVELRADGERSGPCGGAWRGWHTLAPSLAIE